MVSIDDLLKSLEVIYYNVENRDWKNIKDLIDTYKERLEKEKTSSMQFLSLLLDYNTLSVGYDKVKKEPEETKIISIHCVLEDKHLNVEICKKCKTQCVKYLQYLHSDNKVLTKVKEIKEL